MKSSRFAIWIRFGAIAFALVVLGAAALAVPTRAEVPLDVQHHYTPLELADLQRSQLIDLVLALQRTPAEIRAVGAAVITNSTAPSPASRHVHSQLGRIAGAVGIALAGALLIRGHGALGSPSNGSNLDSFRRRATADSTSTCNPATTLGCGFNVTQVTCAAVQLGSGAVSAYMTSQASKDAARTEKNNANLDPNAAAGTTWGYSALSGGVSLVDLAVGCDNYPANPNTTGPSNPNTTTPALRFRL